MKIIHGDCVEVLAKLPVDSIDAIVTDPPYGLEFMGKDWDKLDGAAKLDKGADAGGFQDGAGGNPYSRGRIRHGKGASSARMMEWHERWAREALRVLKPGGHMLVFGGSRTYHAMAMGVELAGFEIRDQIMWVYATGFPKSHNVGKAIDKAAGAKREVSGTARGHVPTEGGTFDDDGYVWKPEYDRHDTPATDEAKQWDGWGTALKPAHEPIVVARKPFKKTVAANVLEHGTGAINVDASRVPAEEGELKSGTYQRTKGNESCLNASRDGSLEKSFEYDGTKGRWPANFIHDGSEEVTDLLGKAARFFYCSKVSKQEANEGLDEIESLELEIKWENEVRRVRLLVDTATLLPKVMFVYGAENSSVAEWHTALFGNENTDPYLKAWNSTTKTETVSIIDSKTLRWLIDLHTSEYTPNVNFETESGGNLVENAVTSTLKTISTSSKMGSLLGVGPVTSETPLRISVSAEPLRNTHPTKKPVKLMRYLCRLVTPPGGTVLDPFTGSGSTGKAALLEGFNFVGIEKDEDYCTIARKRLSERKAHEEIGTQDN